MQLSEVRQRVIEGGCFDRGENERIYRKFFATVPRSFVHIVARYGLDNKRVLDVGCGYGHYLIHFGPGSLGLDANERSRRFAESIGLQVVDCNVEDSLPLPPGSFDAVWCANLLEHLVAPHLLLTRLHRTLTPEGLLAAKVPVVPPWFVRRGLRLLRRPLGFEASEHVNAYTPSTFAFAIERAGFRVVESVSIVLRNPLLQAATSPITRRWGASITVVARKDPSFLYPEKRLEAFDPAWTERNLRAISGS